MKERPLVIAIDCDDVLVPAGQRTIDVYNATYGTRVELINLYDSPPEVWGVEKVDDVLKRFDECLDASSHEFVDPFPEAVPAIRRLASRHELHLVTGRRDFLEPITRRTLDEFFQGCFQTIEHTNHYAPSSEGYVRRSKGEVCRQLGAHVLIDDHPGHIGSAIDYGVRGILFGDYPWNQSSPPSLEVVRCFDWNAVEEEVDRVMEHTEGARRG